MELNEKFKYLEQKLGNINFDSTPDYNVIADCINGDIKRKILGIILTELEGKLDGYLEDFYQDTYCRALYDVSCLPEV